METKNYIELNKKYFYEHWKDGLFLSDEFEVYHNPMSYVFDEIFEMTKWNEETMDPEIGIIDIQINDDDTITVLYAYNDYNQKQPWFSEDKMNIKLVDFNDEPERIFKIV